MTIGQIDVNSSIENTKKLLAEDKTISPALKSAFELLILIINLLSARVGLNSRNSSKPPSYDPNRKKKKIRSGNKRGGQKGHPGKTLEQVSNPDEIIQHRVEKCNRCGGKLHKKISEGHESRQVFELEVKVKVIEHQAETKTCDCGHRNRGHFPVGVTKAVQYGNSVKSMAVYMSVQQLLPYERIKSFFASKFGLFLSNGSLGNFIKDANERLAGFEDKLKNLLLQETILYADETGINIDGKGQWLHNLSSERYTLLFPHRTRGKIAMDEIGVLPKYGGTVVHDAWKPYFRYNNFQHCLCNGHHIRELEWSIEFEKQLWAKKMINLLLKIKKAQENKKLTHEEKLIFRKKYRQILAKGKAESPIYKRRKGVAGAPKKTKSGNLLARMERREDAALLFMEGKGVPFTNNQGERDIRMTKVHQKISGCFRSWEGARYYCRIKSYLETCRKNNINATTALEMCFDKNKMPEFAG